MKSVHSDKLYEEAAYRTREYRNAQRIAVSASEIHIRK